MQRLLLIFMVLFPLAVIAQETNPGPTKNQSGATAPAPGNPSASADKATAKPRHGTKPPPKKSTSEPEMVQGIGGYIDDAVVGTQVRIRFDAAFHFNASDRAEFFYAQYAGLGPNPPGPNSVVADLNFQQLYLNVEYAPTRRLSFLTEVPVRWIQPQLTLANTAGSPAPPNVNEAGLSDVAAGFKLAAVASSNQYLTFQFKAYFPSGNASLGLGTNHYSIEPALLYYRRLSDRIALEAQVGDLHPIGGSSCPLQTGEPPADCVAGQSSNRSVGFAGDVFFYGVGPSYVLYRGERVRFVPVIELVGWRVLGGLVTDNATATATTQDAVSADGTNIVTLKAGARTSIGRHNSFYLGGGYAVTHSRWYQEVIRAEYRFSF